MGKGTRLLQGLSAYYPERVRQKGAQPEGSTGRDSGAHRTASTGQQRLQDHSGNVDFSGLAGCRTFREFENRTEAATDLTPVFEPPAQRKKARLFLAFALRPDGQQADLYELAGGLGFELASVGWRAKRA